ncbi:MAG: Toxin co-regulated pilus biosynthesis protein Q [Idiomarinaceae bacterium HL-53]|nr:MAG: Toxin co-regulated pilus biosynthesis protein Q [Idiomarinaceae bacterium HL-53]CUS48507.1 Toxin co-regulated pilus biosynthesis protein Q [Idiomarinaceae bacterium HL-53]
MSTNPRKKAANKKKSQQRAVVILFVMTIVLLVVAFVASQNMYLTDSDDNRRAQFTGSGGGYQNLQDEISRFFGGVRETAWGRGVDEERVIELEEDTRPLPDIMEQRARSTGNPIDTSWRGEVKTRWFMAEETLKSNVERFANEEDMELIWRLPNDYKVSSAFQVHSDLINTVDRLARSLNSEHPDDIQAFLCPRQRIILLSGNADYEQVSNHCYTMEQLQTIEREAKAQEEDNQLQRRGLN